MRDTVGREKVGATEKIGGTRRKLEKVEGTWNTYTGGGWKRDIARGEVVKVNARGNNAGEGILCGMGTS